MVTYQYTGNPKIPSMLSKNGQTTPVWIQQLWDAGEYAEYVVKNGCGHCCTAMAANLHGVQINPHEEYAYCRKLWGTPTGRQQHFLSVTGMAKVLESMGIVAKAYPVTEREMATAQIVSALDAGKIVAFVSKPCAQYPDNPFSSGSHWVLAAGYDAQGKIVVANSSNRAKVQDGIHTVEPQDIHNALYIGDELDEARTWGILEPMGPGVGFVVIG